LKETPVNGPGFFMNAQAQLLGNFDKSALFRGAGGAATAQRNGDLNIRFRLYSLSVGLRNPAAC
jgi:hypothetical protein